MKMATIEFEFGHLKGKLLSEVDGFIWWIESTMSRKGWKQRPVSKTNVHILLSELKACSRTQNLSRGIEVHAKAVDRGHGSNIYVESALINMYAKCGSMEDARRVFDNMEHPDVVSCNALILGYADNGQALTALAILKRLKSEGPVPNSVTLVAALKACTRLALKEGASGWKLCRERGKEIHDFAMKIGCDSDIYVVNTMIDMYARCGSMVDARQVFDTMQHPDVVSWSALILGYARIGQGHTALDLFARMTIRGIQPDSVALMAALKACTSLAMEGPSGTAECKERGKEIHDLIMKNGYSSDINVQNTLIDMYAKCGSMLAARQIFDSMKYPDVVSWSALISGYAENGQGLTSLCLFTRMQGTRVAPTSVTFLAVLKACISLAVKGEVEWREWVKRIHDLAVKSGCDSDSKVQSTLIDMYAKCGSMQEARQVFDGVKNPNLVSWTALIMGYADNGQERTALELFKRMDHSPDSVTFLAVFKACTCLAVKGGPKLQGECRELGKEVHEIALRNGCDLDVKVQNTLIDMYVKCCSMMDAHQVFDSMKQPDVVSWNSLILGYANSGQGHTALDLFTRMKNEGCGPNAVTFAAVLKACGLVGGLEFGRKIHSEIERGNELDLVLVTCLVDFYARCGSLVEAQDVFDLHAELRDVKTWTALLAGFSSCGDHESVFQLFEKMQDGGSLPDSVTFLCVLTCCSHAGLVVKGKECFDTMSSKYGILPTAEHYNCMIDMFGRANRFGDAMALVERMPCNPDDVIWMSILGACRKWKNVEVGKLAFQSLINLNERDMSAYVLMGQIYGSRGMLQEQEMVMGMREKFKACKTPEETCWTNEVGEVHTFMLDDNRHSQMHEIFSKWKSMALVIREQDHVLNSDKEEALCGHTERLAIACALINTKPGKTIRVVKNLKICDTCHTAIAFISKLECRTIICRDASRTHVFKDRNCSCNTI